MSQAALPVHVNNPASRSGATRLLAATLFGSLPVPGCAVHRHRIFVNYLQLRMKGIFLQHLVDVLTDRGIGTKPEIRYAHGPITDHG